uniref:Telomere_reg-2 domain-containing protein n=1 Tax=Caenorhabditis tropicalis TaxID=1561998 RepID=A0A1I7UJ82_9PELO
MNGVHSRMGMLPIYVQSALFVNSTLSAIATKEEDAPEPPKAENSTWIQELEAILEQGIEKGENQKIGERRNSEEDLRQPLLQKDSDSEEEILPPSRLNSSPLPSAAPIDSDDDEEFPVYQLDASESKFRNLEPGEEPRSKIPPPSYIVDAYEWLLEKENPEIFEAAFFHLKSLIDRRAIGFTQIAEKLFVRVVHLQNSFGTRNFDETVDKIATACITQRPEIVPALVRLLIAPGQAYPIQHRLLQCIHKAADEMGALDKRNEQFVTEQELRVGGMTMDHVQQEPEDEEIAGLRAMFDIRIPEARIEAEARILANTRRFGTSARERPRAGVVNRLAKAAKYMFYPLLVTPRGENARLLSKDADLLAYIIMVASMIYVRCGVNPAVAKMTTELIAYAAPHRYSENAKLRTACMAAYLNVLALIPGNMLAELFPIEERQEWLEWLNAVQMNPETQQMEHNMGHQMHSIIEENIEQFNPIAFYQSRHLY